MCHGAEYVCNRFSTCHHMFMKLNKTEDRLVCESLWDYIKFMYARLPPCTLSIYLYIYELWSGLAFVCI